MTGKGRHRRHRDGSISRARGVPVVGELLRSLRLARSWTQRKAAERGGISDRLIRKAEIGGPLEQKSVELLAQLYSTPDQPVTADDLIDSPLHSRGGEADSQHHERLLRRWFDEVWHHARLEAIEEMASLSCTLEAEGVTLYGPDAIRQRAEAIRSGFSDFEVRFEQVIAHHDMVVGRWRMAMTNTGVWMGMPPTNRRLVVRGSTWMRVSKGRISQRWDFWEWQQLTDAVLAAQQAPAPRGRKKTPRARKGSGRRKRS